MLVSRPPKGGTLAAVGVASPNVQDNPSPLESRVYAEHRFTFHHAMTKGPAYSKPFRVFRVFRG
ncbi:MAG: hypothetical protein GX456_10510 [Verrucomicrobia bacterium]|nr:hypothetical protein [Verrucomicrobiota bacterium]